MLLELRILSLAILLVGAIATFAGAAPLTGLLVVGLILGAFGLLPPMPPLINGVGAAFGGVLIAAAALASGCAGWSPVAVPVLAMISLRLGWRPALWSGLTALALGFAVAPNPSTMPLVAGSGWLLVAAVPVWAAAHLLIGLQPHTEATPPVAPTGSGLRTVSGLD